MGEYLSMIVPMGFNFAQRGWAQCHGQLLPIAQNSALFSLLGTMYGGDGRTTFALPDLRGRAPVSEGRGPGLSNYTQGQKTGAEVVTLISNELPSHSHSMVVDDEKKKLPASNGFPARRPLYGTPPANLSLRNGVIGNTGGSQSHENRLPFLAINWCICIQGQFPSRS